MNEFIEHLQLNEAGMKNSYLFKKPAFRWILSWRMTVWLKNLSDIFSTHGPYGERYGDMFTKYVTSVEYPDI